MPKMKTKKSAAKKYNFTSSGKLKHRSPGVRHILTKKSAKRKRQLGKNVMASPVEEKRAKVLLPYK